MVTDTKLNTDKTCSKCGETKLFEKFIKDRNICKCCRNTKVREKYKNIQINDAVQICNSCNQSKPLIEIVKNRTICKECNNSQRRMKYQSDEEHRLKLIQQATVFKHCKVLERRQKKLEEIGEGNKKCSNCSTIKPECRFRHNRLKCKDCERDEPVEKFKRYIRSRIHSALKKKKDKHTIEYLGCDSSEYLQWILTYNENYTLENHGKIWHIDHVIPISKFDLDNEEQQMIAFNWRNTMPLTAKENLSKNNKILVPQVEQHYQYLMKYHKEKNLDLPQIFVELYAKHLVDGKSLKQSLPLQFGNSLEELG